VKSALPTRGAIFILALLALSAGIRAQPCPMGTWSQRLAFPDTRWGHGSAYDTRRLVTVVFGGSGSGGPLLDETWEWTSATGTWDGAANAWKRLRPTGYVGGRSLHAMAFDRPRSRIVMFGGFGGEPLGDTWEFVIPPTGAPAWIQRFPTTSPGPRNAHSIAFD